MVNLNFPSLQHLMEKNFIGGGGYIIKSDLVKKLEDILYLFDEEFHDEYDLEMGTSRKYIFRIENDILNCEINYEWNYSIGSKWQEVD